MTWCRDKHEPCHIEHQDYSRACGEECCIPTCDEPCCKINVIVADTWWPLYPYPKYVSSYSYVIYETNGVAIRSRVIEIIRLDPPTKKIRRLLRAIESKIPIAKVVRLRGVATK